MRGWRIKLIFLLIVYFAGFATAIYCFGPAPEGQTSVTCESERSFTFSSLKSDEFAKSFNTGMHKCIDFGKDAALRVGEILKQKLEERRNQNEG